MQSQMVKWNFKKKINAINTKEIQNKKNGSIKSRTDRKYKIKKQKINVLAITINVSDQTIKLTN